MKTIPKNYWKHVSIGDSCWLWVGGLMKNGYANFHTRSKSFRVHRLMYQSVFGKIPDGHGVLHKCDTRNCVNPKHLFSGTQKTNLQDCKAKGRTTIGERNAQAKLGSSSVLKIRSLASSLSQGEIAYRFSITQSCVSRILNRITWAHI